MTDWALKTTSEPDPAELETLHDGLRAGNLARLGPKALSDYLSDYTMTIL